MLCKFILHILQSFFAGRTKSANTSGATHWPANFRRFVRVRVPAHVGAPGHLAGSVHHFRVAIFERGKKDQIPAEPLVLAHELAQSGRGAGDLLLVYGGHRDVSPSASAPT